MPLRGVFISLDGPEGSGKSTQARRLVAGLRQAGYRVTFLRDPGSTPLGRSLRRLLLYTREPLPALTEALLFIGGRVRLVEDKIMPALRQGRVVVCDRFHDSTVVYQGYGGGVPVEQLDRIGRRAIGGLMPSLTLLLHVEARRGFARLRRAKDRMERKADGFHQRVARGYLAWARRQRPRIAVIDAARPVDVVQQDVRRLVRRRLGLRIT